MQTEVVIQDVDALAVLEERVTVDPDPFEVNVKIDRGSLAARRILQGMAATSRRAALRVESLALSTWRSRPGLPDGP